METITLNRPNNVVERNILLTGEVMQYLLGRPQVFATLPDQFELVILPDDDPELRAYNLELLDQHSRNGVPVVFARMHMITEQAVYHYSHFNLYAPIAA